MPGFDTELSGNDRSFVFTTWKHVSGAGEETYIGSHTRTRGIQRYVARDRAGATAGTSCTATHRQARGSAGHRVIPTGVTLATLPVFKSIEGRLGRKRG